MAKGDKFYFNNFIESTEISARAAAYLVECMTDYDPENVTDMVLKMHEIEHSGDEKKHEMSAALAKAFVTPIDREDLDMLSHRLDDVTDSIEEILQKFYMDDIKTVTEGAIQFAKNIEKSCRMLNEIMTEFEDFKRSKKIKELIIKLNSQEEECDRLYLKAMRDIRKETDDILEIIAWREIYECFESCADACENVSDCVGTVIMKNT